MSEGEGLKIEVEAEAEFEPEEACCVCGASGAGAELSSPEEHDAGAGALQPDQPPLRAMLLHLNNNKVVPNGRLCPNCIRRTLDAYNFSQALASKGPPPLSEKIRALRKRLHELTQKIDVFIVVGGGGAEGGGAGGGAGAYSEQDIIMVERSALASCARADAADAALRPDARGAHVYQCTVCPLTFTRMCEFRSHSARHPADAAHTCWACGARCASPAELADHQLTHAPTAPLHCHLCNTTFQSSAEERRHEASCPPVCPAPACGAQLPSRAALRAHVAARHADTCAHCLLPCGSAPQRAAHALHHRRDRHFVCGYKACILRFHTRSNLMSHIRKCHGGDPETDEPPAGPAPPAPVPCAHCPRTFASQAAMKRHARTHQTKNSSEMQELWTAGDHVEYLEVETLDEGEPDVQG